MSARRMSALVVLLLSLMFGGGPLAAQTSGNVRVVPTDKTQQTEPEIWKKGPSSSRACIDVSTIAAAVVVDPVTLDIVMRGGKRWRLFFTQECHQLGFYDGIYYRPNVAGSVCAGKDRIMSRAGGSCRIRSIAPLYPAKPKSRR